MAAYSSLYRKYRSQTFDELVGQEPVVRTLKNAIASNLISHAYLFTGPRGVGKTSAARLLARAANCLSEGEKPCNTCANCVAANRDIATDLIEIDAASNTGVDNIREVIERANFAPSIWNTKFYIIDEVHMLSTSAFNALLKTLEEPPAHTSFILATTEVHKVPATVASRCQRFDFRRIPLKAMVDRLQYICDSEGITAEAAALEVVARQATGSLRDALSLLDRLRVYSDGGVSLSAVQEMLGAGGSEEVAALIDSVLARDLAGALRRVNAALDEGRDLRQMNRQIVEHLRNLMLVKSGAAAADDSILDVTDESKSRLKEQAQAASLADLLRWTRIFGESDAAIKATTYGQLPLEMALVEAVLDPEPVLPAAEVRDRGAELREATQQVGVPRRNAQPQQAPPAPPARSSPPPPIHLDLAIDREAPAKLNTNGSHQPNEEPETALPAEQADQTPELDVAPVAAAPPPEGNDELARLRESWPAVIDQINARSKQMAAYFRNPEMVRPVSLARGECVLSFRDPFYAKKTQGPPYREIIEVALSRAVGYTCKVESITFAQEGAAPAGEQPAEKKPAKSTSRDKPSPYETTRGKAAINIFGIDKFEDTQ